MRIKDDFHHLIDSIDNEEMLKAYYQLVQTLNSSQNIDLWERLTDQQKQDVMLSYEESFNDKNLISHKEVKQKYSEWLKK